MSKALVFLIAILYGFIYMQTLWLDDYHRIVTNMAKEIDKKDELIFRCEGKRIVYKNFTSRCVFEGLK